MVTRQYPRRSVLRTGAAGLGFAAFAGLSGVATGQSEQSAPEIRWVRAYPGSDREYEHAPRAVRQTADGGYVLGGEGAPITESGPERSQFSCLKADAAGEPDWIAFGLDDHELELKATTDLVHLQDGTATLVGQGEYPERAGPERWYEPIARAITFSSDGDVAWTAVFDQFADDADEAIAVDGGPRFAGLTRPIDGGGPLAVGTLGEHGWAVKFTGEGSTEWQRTYENELRIANAFTTPDGYRLHAVREDQRVVLHLDPAGVVEREVVLDIDYETIPYNHVVIPTTDGGAAITGRHDGRQRMVLQKFDESGSTEWLETYNGPYDGYDWAFDLVQTDDDGFALFGRMDAAYTGESVPAVVKTDSTGTEEWRTLYEDEPRSRYRQGIQTSDGGFAAFNGGANNTLVKYAGDGPAPATETDADSDSGADGDAGAPEGSSGDDEPSADDGADPDATADPDSADESNGTGNSTGEGDTVTSEAQTGEDDNADGDNEGTTSQRDDTDAGEDETQAQTDDEIPGFGVGAAIGGLGGAVLYRLLGERARSEN